MAARVKQMTTREGFAAQQAEDEFTDTELGISTFPRRVEGHVATSLNSATHVRVRPWST